MRTPSDRLTTALVMTGVAVTLAACDREVAGPEPLAPSARDEQIGVLIAPSHDDFDAAVVVTSLPFTSSANTTDATTDADDPDCVGQGPTVWYAFTAPETGFYEADTFGSDYDTTLGAYTGTRGNLTEIACNDDTDTLQSRVLVELQAGETVYFMVGAFDSGPGGNLVFNLRMGSPPPPPLEVGLTLDRLGSFDPHTGIATLRGTLTCSRPAFVDLFGLLQDRIGRIRVEAFFSGFFLCEGSTPWEVQVIAENALLVGGPAQVLVEAVFFDPESDAIAFTSVAETVRLRGSPSSMPGPPNSHRPTGNRAASLRSLKDVIRHNAALK